MKIEFFSDHWPEIVIDLIDYYLHFHQWLRKVKKLNNRYHQNFFLTKKYDYLICNKVKYDSKGVVFYIAYNSRHWSSKGWSQFQIETFTKDGILIETNPLPANY